MSDLNIPGESPSSLLLRRTDASAFSRTRRHRSIAQSCESKLLHFNRSNNRRLDSRRRVLGLCRLCYRHLEKKDSSSHERQGRLRFFPSHKFPFAIATTKTVSSGSTHDPDGGGSLSSTVGRSTSSILLLTPRSPRRTNFSEKGQYSSYRATEFRSANW